MGYKVGLTEAARDDLGAAVRFIAIEGQNPEAASRLRSSHPAGRLPMGIEKGRWHHRSLAVTNRGRSMR